MSRITEMHAALYRAQTAARGALTIAFLVSPDEIGNEVWGIPAIIRGLKESPVIDDGGQPNIGTRMVRFDRAAIGELVPVKDVSTVGIPGEDGAPGQVFYDVLDVELRNEEIYILTLGQMASRG